jgi:hypothetical protein
MAYIEDVKNLKIIIITSCIYCTSNWFENCQPLLSSSSVIHFRQFELAGVTPERKSTPISRHFDFHD